MVTSPGNLILALVKEMETAGILCVYLRNHEYLPDDIGNDVDLLIPEGLTSKATDIITKKAKQYGWRVIRKIQFSPLSIFLTTNDSDLFIHIDLFERLEWHFIEYAKASKIIKRRLWNGQVHIPYPADELYLNISTRLLYQGIIRDKHRIQTRFFVDQGLQEEIRETFSIHLGRCSGLKLANAVLNGEWHAAEAYATAIKRNVTFRSILLKPVATISGFYKYLSRTIQRILTPPGPFMILEGDISRTSNIIEAILPLFKEITGRSDTIFFSEKNGKTISIQDIQHNKTSHIDSSHLNAFSLLSLFYDWFGFWYKYIRYLLPARSKNRAVIGIQYAHEFFISPRCGRLSKWIIVFAARTKPQPDFIIKITNTPDQTAQENPNILNIQKKYFALNDFNCSRSALIDLKKLIIFLISQKQ